MICKPYSCTFDTALNGHVSPVFVDSSVDIHRRYNQENQEDYCQHEECNGTPYKDGWKITYVDNPVSIVLFSWGS